MVNRKIYINYLSSNNMKKLICPLLLLLSLAFVSAACTVTFDKSTNYSQGEIITVQMTCSEVAEKNDAYTLNWTNATGYQIEIDTGTTPAQVDTNFFETFAIPSDYVTANGTNITATLQGDDLEGSDSANISVAGTNDLIIKDVTLTSSLFIGKLASVKARIYDENDKQIDNALCRLEVLDEDNKPVNVLPRSVSLAGEIAFSTIINANALEEGRQYGLEIYCSCGIVNTTNGCYDEDGLGISASNGEVTFPFTMNTWLEVNTLVDKTSYEMKEEIFICANVTNYNSFSRIPMHIYSQIRCSKGVDNDNDLDRILIASTRYDNPQIRGISNGTTQMQCQRFIIPEEKHLMGRDSECYASTDVWVLNDLYEEILGYHTTSSVFNISSDEINLEPDWQWVKNKALNSIINLSSSKFIDIDAKGIGNVDVRLDFHPYELDIKHIFDMVNAIKNITIKNTTSTLVEHIDYELEFLEDGYVELELRDVNYTKTNSLAWWNITLEFYNLDYRQTEALEGIENKTGTFSFSIEVPQTSQSPSYLPVNVSAQVEIGTEVEGHFICYLQSNQSETEIRWTHAVNSSNAYTVTQNLTIPSGLSNYQTVVCKLGETSFTNMITTATDTFLVQEAVKGGFPLSYPEYVTKVVDLVEEAEEAIDFFKRYWWMLLVLCSLIFIFFDEEKKKKIKKKE